VLLEEFIVAQLIKKFSSIYGTRRFITWFKTACHLCWTLSWNHTLLHYVLRYILILFSHLRLGRALMNTVMNLRVQ